MTPQLHDRFGATVEAADEEAVSLTGLAVLDLVRLSGEPVALVERALELEPSLALARALGAYLHLYAGSSREAGEALRLLEPARPAAARERAHVEAARHWAAGSLEAATRSLEAALLAEPRDLLALKVAQDLYFALGDRISMRDVAARVLPSWPPEAPGSGFVLAMHAFGLEECGEYGAALDRARAALDADERDVWAVHAVLHVHEMAGRPEEGLTFAKDSSPRWSESFFAVHNWWHAGLFELALARDAAALETYDSRVRDGAGALPLALLDAASLAWRLALLGQDLADRGESLAAAFEPMIGDSTACFNDWHAAMAFGLARRADLTGSLLSELAARAVGSNAAALDAAGLSVLRGFAAFSAGRPGESVALLAAARPRAYRIGGSHAQRDVLELTLLAAASACGERRLVRALLAEREARSASAAALGRRVVDANRPPRRAPGGVMDADPAPRRPPSRASEAATDLALLGGADALEAFGEFDLLEEEAADLGVGWEGPPAVRRVRIETAEGALSAISWGGGAPEAVLVHGVALNAHSFDAVALALGRPVAALDLPGHGESQWRKDGRYGATTLAPALVEAVASLSGGGATVLGHSLGGLTAIEASRLAPGLIGRLVLVDISPGLRSRRGASVRAFLAGPQSFGSREEIVERAIAFGYGASRAALERGVWHNTTRRPDGTVLWKHHIGQLPDGGVVPITLSDLWEPLEELGRRGVEVLLVWAERGFLGEQEAAELCRRVPGARAVRVPGGHNVQELEPMRLAAILRHELGRRGRGGEA